MLEKTAEYLAHAPLLALMVVYIGGVFTSFTPCLYPVIPITATYIGARSAGSRMKGFLLSLSHVLGIALTYAVLGFVAASTGRLFGNLSSNPWVLFVIGNILLLLALSMLDVYTIPVLQLKNSASRRGGHIGAFLMGILAGFVAAPCTAPVLGAILTFVARGQNPLLGFVSLFLFGLGLGTLLIMVGTFAGLISNLPKPGPWMQRIKKGFGWLMLIIGEYFLIQSGRYFL